MEILRDEDKKVAAGDQHPVDPSVFWMVQTVRSNNHSDETHNFLLFGDTVAMLKLMHNSDRKCLRDNGALPRFSKRMHISIDIVELLKTAPSDAKGRINIRTRHSPRQVPR